MDPRATSVLDLTDPDNASPRSDPNLAKIADSVSEPRASALADFADEPRKPGRIGRALPDLQGSVKVTSYTFNKAAFEVNTPAGGLFNFSDGYARGWRASIDGADTVVYRVNHAFKGVVLPPGGHHVEFVYDPPSFRFGLLISLASACFFAVCAASCLTRVTGRRLLLAALTGILALPTAGFVYERVYERVHRGGFVNYVPDALGEAEANRQSSTIGLRGHP